MRVRKLSEDAVLPAYSHVDDAGMDLVSAEACVIPSGRFALVRTGISIELPENTEGQIRPRSGLALKHGVTVLNSPGTVDAGYRGEIGVILINHGQADFVVTKGAKIAQLVVAPVLREPIVECSQLSESSRGGGGFGSTGAK